jgi:formylglycine-generating enzyme required for sulfatase activity/serine/threonine protein kinase
VDSISDCPTAADWQRLASGQVSEEEAESLEGHLLGCAACLQVVESLPADDPVLGPLEQAAPAGPPHGGDTDVWLRRLKEVLPWHGVPGGETHGESLSTGNGSEAAANAMVEVGGLLTPAEGPGEIGRLGGYRVLEVLGTGGMGVVFLAEDPVLHRRLALKTLKPALAASETARQRFLREAQAAAAIEHDHVIPILHVGEEGGVPFLAMPLLHGESLETRLRREGKLPVSEVLRIGREAAEGLAAAHAKGLIHRDVKPANIWLEDRSDGRRACRPLEEKAQGGPPVATGGRVKLLDFGLARAAGGSGLTQTGAVVGTPSYMAPEQARGAVVDARADLFSLGCVLYRAATGQPPFEGRDTLAVLSALALDEPKPPQELAPCLPAALSDLILQLLAKQPADRPPNAEAVADALRPLEHPAPNLPAAPRTPPSPGPSPDEEIVLPPPSPARRSRGARRKPGFAASIRIGKFGCSLTLSLLAASVMLTGILFYQSGIFRLPSPLGSVGVPEGGTQPVRPALLDCTGAAGVSVAAVRQAQEAWAKYLGRQVEEQDEVAPGVKMAFVLVPPGKFLMGSPVDERDRSDVEWHHEVTITQPFYLGKYEVTQAQYEALLGKDNNPSRFKGPDIPVESVTWDDVVAYAHGLTKKRADGLVYRLPTESEWEYACRGGPSSHPFGVGNGTSLSSDQANFDGNSPYGGAATSKYLVKTTPVGSYPPNAFGLHDMHGNVSEWCADWYGAYPVGKAANPVGPAFSQRPLRVVRGGSWRDAAGRCRAASRDANEPGYRDDHIGFRLARVPFGKKGTSPGEGVAWAAPPHRDGSLIDWRRLFNLPLTDFCTGSPFLVEPRICDLAP